MTAIELSKKYYATGVMSAVEAAAMLRRQYEAIVKLREVLEEAEAGLEWYQSMVPAYTDGSDDEAMERINSALADTEEIAK